MTVASTDPVSILHGACAPVVGRMLYIDGQVKALELAVDQNTGLVFDHAERFIESACKSILTELRGRFDKSNDPSILFREGVQAVLAAQAADAIIGFLYRVHRQDLTWPRPVSMAYDDHPESGANQRLMIG